MQVDSIRLIPDRNQLCELQIIDIGTTENKHFQIYQIVMSIGISCRGVYRTVFYHNNNYLGFFNSDIILPKTIHGDTLAWEFESGNQLEIDLSEGIPESINVDNYKIEFKKP